MSIARPLHDMVKKDRKWEWMEKQKKVFEELKKKFTQKPVLAALDLDKKNENGSGCFRLCYGSMLSMEGEDGKWRLVAFLSKFLNKIERNYEIHEKEMLVIIKRLESWRHLLEGAQFKFEIWIDCKNLEYFMKVQKLNQRQVQ